MTCGGDGRYGGFSRFLVWTSKAGGKMTTQRSRLSKTEYQEYRARLLRLKQLGTPIGSADDPSPEPDRLILEQIQPAFARLYELPSGAAAVVVPARMTVLTSGILITAREMTTGLDDWPLDFSDPNEWPYYQDVIGGLLPYSPAVLNDWLTSGLPLRPRQVEGVIIANGWISVPPECHDETLVTVKLLLWDERSNEICFEFEVRVDRSLKRMYERRQRERSELVRLTKRVGLYEPAAGQTGNQKNVSPEERQASREHDAELRRPN